MIERSRGILESLSASFFFQPGKETVYWRVGVVRRERSVSLRAASSSTAAQTEFRTAVMRAMRSSGDDMIVFIALQWWWKEKGESPGNRSQTAVS